MRAVTFDDGTASVIHSSDVDGEYVLHADYARLKAEKEAETRATFDAIRTITELRDENERLAEFMKRFDWILYTHNCKGGTSATHDALDKLRNDYLEWMNPEEEQS